MLLATAQGARGSTIFFATSGQGRPSGQLWSVRGDGSMRHLLRKNVPVGFEGPVAAVARGSHRILCICRPGEVDSIRADGSDLLRLGALPQGALLSWVALSSSGWMVWMREGDPGAEAILAQRLDGSRRHVVVSIREPGHATEGVSPLVPGLDQVAFAAMGAREIRIVDLVSGRVERLIHAPANHGVADLQWLPGASRLAYVDTTYSHDKGPKGERLPAEATIFVARPGKAGAGRPLFPIALTYADPYFSPNGSSVVLTKGSEPSGLLGVPGEPARLFTVPTQGGEPAELVQTTCFFPECAFSPRVFGWTP